MTRVACLQLSSPPRKGRAEHVERVASRVAKLRDVELVVLPELWPIGFFDFDAYAAAAEPLSGRIVSALRGAARAAGAWVAGGSIVERAADGRLFNTAFLADPDGEIALTYRKIHTFGYRSREAELLDAGDTAGVANTPFGGLGLTTCYDLRFPELFRVLVDAGAALVVVPAAWPEARREHWRLLTRTRALENQVFLVACAARGVDNGIRLAGTSAIVDPHGEVVAEARPGDELLLGDIDLDRVRSARAEFPVLSDRRFDVVDRELVP